MKIQRAVTPIIAGLSISGMLVTGCGTSSGGTSSPSASSNATSKTASNAAGSSSGSSTGSSTSSTADSSTANSSSQGQSGSAAKTGTANGTASGIANGTTNGTASTGTGSSGGGTSSNANSTGWPSPGSWLTVSVKKVGQLPVGILGNALAMSPKGQPVSVGGYTGQVSITNVYQLLPQTSTIANLPVRTHDAAVGYAGNTLYVFGGGQAASYNTVVAIQNGKAKTVTTLSRPLSDAASAPLSVGGQQGLALVGGYDGSVFRTDVAFMSVSSSGARTWKKLFNLPIPVRYPAVTSSGASGGDTLYIAGGRGQNALASGVYAWSSTSQKLQKVAALPNPTQKAALFAAGPYLIFVGGETSSGKPNADILEIDTRTGKSKVVGKFPTPIADMGYTQSNSVGYIAGGITTASDSSATKSVYAVTWKR